MGKRALILRVGIRADHMGLEGVQLADGFKAMYNVDGVAPSLYDVCLNHAEKHQGRILLPIGTHLSLKNIYMCDTLILLFIDRKYLQGDIVDSGSPYIQGMGDEQYSVPSVMRYERENLWVKLDNLKGGAKFNPDGWRSDKFAGERQLTLAEAAKRSHSAALFALKD